MNNDSSSPSRSGRTPSQEDISQRAYQIWQDSGSPDGAHDDHWLQAERELTLGNRGVSMDAAPATGGPSRGPGVSAPATTTGSGPARSGATPAPASTTPNSASGSSSVSGQGASAYGSGRGSTGGGSSRR